MDRPRARFRLFLPLLCCFALPSRGEDAVRRGPVYATGRSPSRASAVPDFAKRTVDFIEEFGFRAEIHEVTTEDGYVLALHRIVGTSSGAAVIVQHGIAASSAMWLLSREKSFPFLLADAGFDVWLLDTRGNSYSHRHAFLRTTDPEYWRFSFHEQGTLDLAAATDYVSEATGNEKVFYVGHSRGTTMALALLSTRPEYNDKFRLVVLFAPVAYVRHVRNPLLASLFANSIASNLRVLLDALGAYIVPGSSDASVQFRQIICNRTELACINLVFSFSGFDYELLNKTMIPVYMSHYPEGGAVQEFLHYLQIGTTDEFRQFDYGREKNGLIYGRLTPPAYNLSRIVAPISLHHADNDPLVRPPDLNRLARQLKNVVADVRVPFKKFTHTDFLWATKADVLLYRPTIRLMEEWLPPRTGAR